MNTFECPFSFHSRKNPKNLALIYLKKKWCYYECNEIIDGITKNLKRAGVKKGDKVTFFPSTVLPTPLLFLSIFRLEAIACPLNVYLPKNLIQQTLNELGSSFFLYENASSIPQIKQTAICFSSLFKNKGKSNKSFLNKDTHATYLFTSGTSAKPKIACHSIGNHYYSALGSNAYMQIDQSSRYLLSLPIYHIAGIGILFRTFLAGGTLVLSNNYEQEKITHLSFVPTQLYRFLKQTPKNSLKHILLGGQNLSFSLIKKARQHGYKVYPTYGMTEMSSQITTQYEPHNFSVGHALPFREIMIEKDNEILVRGKTLFQGYLNSKNAVCPPKLKEGWFSTQDLGTYSCRSGLKILGRKDRLFISGGENIHPEEIENLLLSIKGIDIAKVVPIPDKEFGFRPIAYIKGNKSHEKKELKLLLSSFLPNFKIPDEFYQIENNHDFF